METRELIGASAKFRALLDEVNLVAKVDSTVLIQGETGTGKELIARATHEAGPRCGNRFVALNCAAIPATLVEQVEDQRAHLVRLLSCRETDLTRLGKRYAIRQI